MEDPRKQLNAKTRHFSAEGCKQWAKYFLEAYKGLGFFFGRGRGVINCAFFYIASFPASAIYSNCNGKPRPSLRVVSLLCYVTRDK